MGLLVYQVDKEEKRINNAPSWEGEFMGNNMMDNIWIKIYDEMGNPVSILESDMIICCCDNDIEDKKSYVIKNQESEGLYRIGLYDITGFVYQHPEEWKQSIQNRGPEDYNEGLIQTYLEYLYKIKKLNKEEYDKLKESMPYKKKLWEVLFEEFNRIMVTQNNDHEKDDFEEEEMEL